MNRVVFDIETFGFKFEELTPEQQEYLLRTAKTEEEVENVKRTLSLFPFTARIVTIAMYNIDSDKAEVLYSPTITDDFKRDELLEEKVRYITLTEKEILERFWEYIPKYDMYITFNGKCFDIPFIKIRSAILGIKCSYSFGNGKKFSNNNSGFINTHIDLVDVLTFQGCIRRFNLDFYCRAFGIKSPKENISGKDVQEYMEQGRGLEVAKYCYKDVLATAELFNKCNNSFLS